MQQQSQAVQQVFRALSHPTRRDILVLLSKQDMPIGDVVQNFDMTRAAVKKHLNILREGNLISVRREGRERINRLNPAPLSAAAEWLSYFDQFWDDRLRRLQEVIARDQETTQKGGNDD